jgi:hypothetical protein
MPFGGRSYSSLFDLAQGVVLAASNFYEQGQFDMNGQHPDANYFLVAGVSANLGTVGTGFNLGQSGAGQLPATRALGGLNCDMILAGLRIWDGFRKRRFRVNCPPWQGGCPP